MKVNESIFFDIGEKFVFLSLLNFHFLEKFLFTHTFDTIFQDDTISRDLEMIKRNKKKTLASPHQASTTETSSSQPIKRQGLIELSGLAEDFDEFSLQSNALKEALQAVEDMGKKNRKN